MGADFGGVYAGALHVLSTPEHVLGVVALALPAAFQPRDGVRWMLAGLAAGTMIGIVIAAATPLTLPAVPLLAASLAALALVSVVAQPLATPVMAAIYGATGLLHGFANAEPARIGGVDWLAYGGGVFGTMMVCALVLMACVAALTDAQAWAGLAARVVASWITAIGLLYLAVALFAPVASQVR